MLLLVSDLVDPPLQKILMNRCLNLSFGMRSVQVIRRGEFMSRKAFHSSVLVQGGDIPVIMIGAVDGTGGSGEIVRVKRGFARNFLIPRKIAAYKTDENMMKYADLLSEAKKIAARGTSHMGSMPATDLSREKNQELLHSVKTQMELLLSDSLSMEGGSGVIVMHAKATSDGRLYGAVTNADIVHKLRSMGSADVNASLISMNPIKETGEHSIIVAGVTINVSIVAEVEVA